MVRVEKTAWTNNASANFVVQKKVIGMESNVRTLASNLGRFFRPSEAYFVPMKHPRVALRAPAPLVRFMGTKNASSVRKNRLV